MALPGYFKVLRTTPFPAKLMSIDLAFAEHVCSYNHHNGIPHKLTEIVSPQKKPPTNQPRLVLCCCFAAVSCSRYVPGPKDVTAGLTTSQDISTYV
jgi:hypothetical protein